jgi:hypothetical protein
MTELDGAPIYNLRRYAAENHHYFESYDMADPDSFENFLEKFQRLKNKDAFVDLVMAGIFIDKPRNMIRRQVDKSKKKKKSNDPDESDDERDDAVLREGALFAYDRTTYDIGDFGGGIKEILTVCTKHNNDLVVRQRGEWEAYQAMEANGGESDQKRQFVAGKTEDDFMRGVAWWGVDPKKIRKSRLHNRNLEKKWLPITPVVGVSYTKNEKSWTSQNILPVMDFSRGFCFVMDFSKPFAS